MIYMNETPADDPSSGNTNRFDYSSPQWQCLSDIKDGAAAGAVSTAIGVAYLGGPGGLDDGVQCVPVNEFLS
jgi:hypothetical protein